MIEISKSQIEAAEAVEAARAAKGAAQPKRRERIIAADDEPRAEHDTEEWRLTYLDTITLLVAMFVLLISMATFDSERVEEIAQGMEEYSGGGAAAVKAVPPPVPPLNPLEPAETQALPKPTELRRDIIAGVLPEGVRVTALADTVRIEISDSILFASGSADLSPGGAKVLDGLVPFLTRSDFGISVDGHTDNRPIATSRFPSNWELSSARASAVVRHYVGQGVPERRLRAIGYAATQPLDETDTPEGRARNRRVSLVLDLAAQKP